MVSQYHYSVNSIGQRSHVAQSGTAFASARGIAWGYDALGNRLFSENSNTQISNPLGANTTAYTVNGVTQTCLYDAQSRKIAETIGSNSKVIIYDGWNPIAEYKLQNSSFTLHASLLWGLDLSGTLQGAGGVAALSHQVL